MNLEPAIARRSGIELTASAATRLRIPRTPMPSPMLETDATGFVIVISSAAASTRSPRSRRVVPAGSAAPVIRTTSSLLGAAAESVAL